MKWSIREFAYLLFKRLPTIVIGKFIRRNLIYVHWGRGLHNFGDCLSPDILKYYGLTPVYVPNMERADVILAGSILQWLSPKYAGYIIGTGGDKKDYNFKDAKILAVRGALTLENLKQKDDNIKLGDPGLLMPFVYPQKVSQKYKLGIIPHFVDKDEDFIQKWENNWKEENVIFIDVLQSPQRVIKQIKQCQCIVSSSLHGLIIADAFHIQNARFVNRKTMPTSFYDYKFDDYYSSLGVKETCIEVKGDETLEYMINATTLKPISRINKLQADLNEIMVQFCNQFKQ